MQALEKISRAIQKVDGGSRQMPVMFEKA